MRRDEDFWKVPPLSLSTYKIIYQECLPTYQKISTASTFLLDDQSSMLHPLSEWLQLDSLTSHRIGRHVSFSSVTSRFTPSRRGAASFNPGRWEWVVKVSRLHLWARLLNEIRYQWLEIVFSSPDSWAHIQQLGEEVIHPDGVHIIKEPPGHLGVVRHLSDLGTNWDISGKAGGHGYMEEKQKE